MEPKEKKIVVTFYIPKALHVKLKVYAARKLTSMSKVVGKILNEFFEQKV